MVSKEILGLVLEDLMFLGQELHCVSTIGDYKRVLRNFRDRMNLDDKTAVMLGHFVKHEHFLRLIKSIDVKNLTGLKPGTVCGGGDWQEEVMSCGCLPSDMCDCEREKGDYE